MLRVVLALLVVATPAAADVVHLSGGQVVTGVLRSCQGGETVIEPPASAPVLLKIADVVSGEGAGIEGCLGGRTPQPAMVRGKSYGGQVVVAEASSILLLALAAGTGSGGPVYTGLAALVVSPAIVHGLHGNGGRAVGSLAFHLALGVGGLYLGATLASNGDEECCAQATVGAVLGIVASQVIATAIDVSTLAYEEVPSRFGVGVLLPPPRPDHRLAHAPPGLQLSLRF